MTIAMGLVDKQHVKLTELIDKIEEVARSNSSVVYKLIMRRINKSGITDIVIQVIWITVYSKGEWLSLIHI